MIELPEAQTLARELKETLLGKRVVDLLPPTKPHKFCWFSGKPEDYAGRISKAAVADVEAFGFFVEMSFDNGQKLYFNDGVNVRLVKPGAASSYQLLMELDGGVALCFTVAMYGGIFLHGGEYDNEYYLKSRNALSPLAPGFDAHCRDLIESSKPTLSMKAFLATEQRFPGIGNGTAQDILFSAGLNPRRKLSSLTKSERDRLPACIKSVLREMTDLGGRDTEKDIFGNPGKYITKMSKNIAANGCPVCGGAITKESYLGGSVYYCKRCQPLEE